jgi:hypothetical protein
MAWQIFAQHMTSFAPSYVSNFFFEKAFFFWVEAV